MTAENSMKFSVPEMFRRGSLRLDERASVDSGLGLLDIIEQCASLRNIRILDYGCGVKLVQALYERDHPQAFYVGVDVFAKMIKYLQAHCRNDKYQLAPLNFYNEMYNKNGDKMKPGDRLPIAGDPFDIITLFSVITHMIAEDTATVLNILAGYAHKDTKLIMSAFIDVEQKEDFLDLHPDRPLLQASYSREFLESIIESNGWRIKSKHDPIQKLIQYYYVCEPSGA